MEIQALIVVLVLFALLAGLIVVLHLTNRGRRIERLWRLYLLQFSIVAVVLVPAYFGGVLMLAALLVLNLRGQYELIHLDGGKSLTINELAAYAVGTLAVTASSFNHPALAAAALMIGLAITLVAGQMPLIRSLNWRHNRAAASLLLPGALFTHFAYFANLERAFIWLVVIYVIVELNDSLAYIFGKAFGDRKIVPTLSPNKTVLGSLTGLGAAIAIGVPLIWYLADLSVGSAVVLAGVIVVCGIAGDFAISAIKRRVGKKDFPTLLKDHGGVLDIYDALLVAVPGFLLYHQLFLS